LHIPAAVTSFFCRRTYRARPVEAGDVRIVCSHIAYIEVISEEFLGAPRLMRRRRDVFGILDDIALASVGATTIVTGCVTVIVAPDSPGDRLAVGPTPIVPANTFTVSAALGFLY